MQHRWVTRIIPNGREAFASAMNGSIDQVFSHIADDSQSFQARPVQDPRTFSDGWSACNGAGIFFDLARFHPCLRQYLVHLRLGALFNLLNLRIP
jgi:hypothetical protein